MPAVKNVGEPCAGEAHARFDAAAGGNQTSRLRRAALAPPADPTLTTARRLQTGNVRTYALYLLALVLGLLALVRTGALG